MTKEIDSIQYDKRCEHCGSDFISVVFEQLYCSPEHAKRSHQKRKKARRRRSEVEQRNNARSMIKNKVCFNPGKISYDTMVAAMNGIQRLGDYSIAPFYCSCNKIHLGHHRMASREKFDSGYYLTKEFAKLSKSRVRTFALSAKTDEKKLAYGSERQNLIMSNIDSDVLDKLKGLMLE